MNVLFLTLFGFESLTERTIYADLLREFVKNGHNVYAICPTERREHKQTLLIEEKNAKILRLQIGNTQKTNVFEKGISTLSIAGLYKKAVKKYFSNEKFDLVLYSTPPITLVPVIEYVKKRDNARTYLLLKDIFPQNAVDIGILKKTGLKGVIYRYFRNKEKKLYRISDNIGCMSQANVDYLIKHNREVNPANVAICPNSIDVVDKSVDLRTREDIRKKYEIPLDKIVFVYGGNLGKPQGIPFLIECLEKCRDINDAYFLIVGDGTEYKLLETYIEKSNPANVRLMKRLPKDDYDTMIGACDVGLIFLDHRFTIPNFPSRLLVYMQAHLPVLAATDPNTDIGKVIEKGSFGWHCESNDSKMLAKKVGEIIVKNVRSLGENGFKYLCEHYSSNQAYSIIVRENRDNYRKTK